MSSQTVQHYLNGSIYDQARAHLLKGLTEFSVYKPAGTPGDFLCALAYVRGSLIAAGWVNTFTITITSIDLNECAYFSMVTLRTETTHCIFHLCNKVRNEVDVFAQDITKGVVSKLANGDSSALEAVLAIARPLYEWQNDVGLDMFYEIPNGDYIFYISTGHRPSHSL